MIKHFFRSCVYRTKDTSREEGWGVIQGKTYGCVEGPQDRVNCYSYTILIVLMNVSVTF